ALLGHRVEPAKLLELRHEARRHALGRAQLDVPAQRLLEAVPATAVVAPREVALRFTPFGVRQRAVEELLHELLAALARIERHARVSSARRCFNARRPRWSLDMTVPIGMSRISAASAYEKSPMSTSTTTSRNCGEISARAWTIESWERR